MMRFCLITLSLLQAISCRSTNNRELQDQQIEIVDDFGESPTGQPPETIVIIDSGPQLDELQLAGARNELVDQILKWVRGQDPLAARKLGEAATGTKPPIKVFGLEQLRSTQGAAVGKIEFGPNDAQQVPALVKNLQVEVTKANVDGRQLQIAEVKDDLDANLAAWRFLSEDPNLSQVVILKRDPSGKILFVGFVGRGDLPASLSNL